MEKKYDDMGSAICGTLEEVRRVLDMLPVTGKAYCAALVNADNALLAVLDELRSGRVVVTVKEAAKEKGDDSD